MSSNFRWLFVHKEDEACALAEAIYFVWKSAGSCTMIKYKARSLRSREMAFLWGILQIHKYGREL